MNGKILIGLGVVVLYVVSCSHGGPFVKPRVYNVRGSEAAYDVPLVYNDRVEKWVRHFQYENRARFGLYLSRSGRYIPFMRRILKEEGMPQDLVYLAMIESGFSNHAYSRAHAVGPWQFIGSTGRLFDLKINSWVDERKDPEKATRAAARYLKRLYNEFGDWYLAMAAYNAGEGRVRRAIRDSRTRDFWLISSPRRYYLRRETQEYVPKFLAAAVIAKNPERFGFGHVRYEEPIAFDRVKVRGPLGLDVAADLAQSPLHEVSRLNPELQMATVPHGAYSLKIPSGAGEIFRLAYAELPADQRVRVVYHTIQRGDTASKIARRYGVRLDNLLAANDLTARKARFLRPGRRLVVPKSGGLAAAGGANRPLLAYNTASQPETKKKLDGVEYMIRKDFKENGMRNAGEQEERSSPVIDLQGMDQAGLPEVAEEDLGGSQQKVPGSFGEKTKAKQESSYVVRRGDNLWRIAKKHGVGVTDLKAWNGLQHSRIKPGKKLVVSPIASAQAAEPAPDRHVVQRGDNLWQIAKQYGVSVSNLKVWNNLSGTRIQPGKKLVVTPP